jgi:hypothetical protein
MVNEQYISERISSTELRSFSSAIKKNQTKEVFQEILGYTRILDRHRPQNRRKVVRYISDLDMHYSNKVKEAKDVPSYFQEYNINAQKEKYDRHIKIIQELSNNKLAELFSETTFDTDGVERIISLLKDSIDANMIESFEKNLRGSLSQKLSININYHSLLSYLYILPSKKIQKSDIAIDTNSGKIIIFYNSNKTEFNSRKMSIIANEKDFTVSVISRENGLAKFSGVYVSKFPDGYHKIESLMETLA